MAELINLPLAQVERKLSQMILDGKFSGTLEQGKGHLVIFDDDMSADSNYDRGLEIVSNIEQVVEVLFTRARGLVKAPSALTTATATPPTTTTTSAAAPNANADAAKK